MIQYPEWFLIEKKTEKTLSMLSSTKDLSYYLTNQDKYIRRLAILRLGQLKLKESLPLLEEVMADRLECEENKRLAAWVAQNSCPAGNTELFFSSRLFSDSVKEYPGVTERVNFSGAASLPKFDYSGELTAASLTTYVESNRSDEIKGIDTSFPLKEWLKSFRIKPPQFQLPRRKPKFKKRLSPRQIAALLLRPLSLLLRLISLLLRPISMVLKHKALGLSFLAAMYCLLAFTLPGRTLTYKYLGFDFEQAQTELYYSGKALAGYTWKEFTDITGLKFADKTSIAVAATADVNDAKTIQKQRRFIVTAAGGLNLRVAPDASSGKVMPELLPFNTVVTYLMKSVTDMQGREWYFIETPGGKTGWAYSRWLEEKGADQG